MADDSPLAGTPLLAKVLGRSFEEGDTTKYSRSDILRALIAPLSGTGVALPVLAWANAPTWLLAAFAVVFGLIILLYVAVYLYCFFKRPDSLRSESYELTKYAIEHYMHGDSTTGLIEGPVQAISGQLADASGTSR